LTKQDQRHRQLGRAFAEDLNVGSGGRALAELLARFPSAYQAFDAAGEPRLRHDEFRQTVTKKARPQGPGFRFNETTEAVDKEIIRRPPE
jgi:hypothetical protein